MQPCQMQLQQVVQKSLEESTLKSLLHNLLLDLQQSRAIKLLYDIQGGSCCTVIDISMARQQSLR